jgi:hypothetical protein
MTNNEKISHNLTLLLIAAIAIMVALSSCGYTRACKNAKWSPNNACMGKRSNLIGY